MTKDEIRWIETRIYWRKQYLINWYKTNAFLRGLLFNEKFRTENESQIYKMMDDVERRIEETKSEIRSIYEKAKHRDTKTDTGEDIRTDKSKERETAVSTDKA